MRVRQPRSLPCLRSFTSGVSRALTTISAIGFALSLSAWATDSNELSLASAERASMNLGPNFTPALQTPRVVFRLSGQGSPAVDSLENGGVQSGRGVEDLVEAFALPRGEAKSGLAGNGEGSLSMSPVSPVAALMGFDDDTLFEPAGELASISCALITGDCNACAKSAGCGYCASAGVCMDEKGPCADDKTITWHWHCPDHVRWWVVLLVLLTVLLFIGALLGCFLRLLCCCCK